jgi:hypothetical protein
VVTALALAALLGSSPEPAQARQRPLFADPFSGPLQELFQPPRRRPRRAAPVAAAVPLPTPRPADAPQLTAPQPEAPQIAAKPAEPPIQATPGVEATLPVPVPAPRPAEADTPAAPPSQAALPPAPPAPEPPQPSACRLALTEEIAVAPSIPDVSCPGGCGGTDLVRLEAVVLPGKGRVAVKPAAVLRCSMASAVADWIRSDIAPLAAGLNSTPSELDNFDSFECRGRNRVAGAKLSEHGLANAIDLRGIRLADGRMLSLTDRTVARDTREKVLQSVCARFSTVLGPGSDGYHEDHIHLDLASRRSGYRICQWQVYEPMPQVAPLLPAVRPEEAPPREVAEGKTEGNAATPAAAPANAEEEAVPEPAPRPKPAKKRRRVRYP